jgi:DNA-binding CsgD family transcriptional regulator
MYKHSQGNTLDSGQALARISSPYTLSNREIEVLKWAALGKTSWEMSMILEISERTVNFHLALKKWA